VRADAPCQSHTETKQLLDRLRAVEAARRREQAVLDTLSNSLAGALEASSGWPRSEQKQWSDAQLKAQSH